jgi:hypothetical protein
MSKGSTGCYKQTHQNAAQAAIGQPRPKAALAALGLTLSKTGHNFIFCYLLFSLPRKFFSRVLFRFTTLSLFFASDINVSLGCELREKKFFFSLPSTCLKIVLFLFYLFA